MMADEVDALLINLDGVPYVKDAPIAGAIEAVAGLRASVALRFTPTRRRVPGAIPDRLQRLGFQAQLG